MTPSCLITFLPPLPVAGLGVGLAGLGEGLAGLGVGLGTGTGLAWTNLSHGWGPRSYLRSAEEVKNPQKYNPPL